MRPAPESVLSVAARVDARLAAVLQLEVERWVAFDADLAAPFGELQRLVLAGGKRLRPAFTYWGFVGAGGSPEGGTVIDAGAAFELMHAFALFHDDIMDGSTARRGQPTTHEVHRQLHEDHRWAGDARRFGDGVAILVGDLAFVYADVLLAGAPRAAWDLWNELRIELNVGQYLDMLGSAHSERRREKAERICRYKSGKYTIERPLHLGALLAGGSTDLLAAYSAYGLPLGDAFQMRDDVLGAFGESAVTGKPVGDDLREGKPTPLMAIAVARATAAQQQVLAQVGAALLDDAQVATVQQVIVDTGALAELEATITRLTDEAVAAISTAPVSSQVRNALVELAAYVVHRSL